VVLLALFSLAGAAWLVVQSSYLDVDTVAVRGARRVSAEEVVETSGVRRGEALLLVDLGTVTRRVEGLPWVRSAVVSRDLPGRLRIEVTEREPVAWVGGPDRRVALVDADARVLAHRIGPAPGLAEIHAPGRLATPGRHLDRARDAARVVGAAPKLRRSEIVRVARRRGAFVLTLRSVREVRFGPATALAAKWSALELVLERAGEGPVHSIDVRVPTAPALARTPPPTSTTTPTTAPTVPTTSSAPGAGGTRGGSAAASEH
jgi:cell division protein FtsQ